MLVAKILNDLHLLGVFIPFFIPLLIAMGLKSYLKSVLKILLLLYVFVPTHWIFFDRSCFITKITKKMGGYKDSKSKHEFVEANLKWFYKPIMDLLGLKWLDDKDMNSILVGHVFVNIIIIWYYLFYVY